MNILVIGSEGFIGSHCISYFSKKGHNLYGCDLLDYATQPYQYTKISRLNPDFDVLFSDQKYNYCINAAGNGSVPVSVEKPLLDFDANCYDVIRLLQLIKNKSPETKYLHFSSAAVYGNPERLPVSEVAKLQPLSPYGWHKLISEQLCEEYSTLYGLTVAIVRPFSIYGPRLRKQLLWDLFQKAKTETSIELWGDGNESRDFIYIDDVTSAIEIILEHSDTKFDIYNVASGNKTSITSVVKQFYFYLTNNTIQYTFNHQSRPGDPKNWKADISKLLGLGFKTQIDLQQGLKLTAEWLKKSG